MQWVHQGRLSGTGGATGWSQCKPHLHFQRQDQGGWFENSRPIFFDEYPGEQLFPGQPYRSLDGSGYCPYRDAGSGGPVASLILMGLCLPLGLSR